MKKAVLFQARFCSSTTTSIIGLVGGHGYLDPACVEGATGEPTFNFAVNSATVEDYEAIYNFSRHAGRPPKHIIIGVDPQAL